MLPDYLKQILPDTIHLDYFNNLIERIITDNWNNLEFNALKKGADLLSWKKSESIHIITFKEVNNKVLWIFIYLILSCIPYWQWETGM